MNNARLDFEKLFTAAAKRALVDLGPRESAALRAVLEGLVARLDCCLDMDRLLSDIDNYPLDDDWLSSARNSPDLLGRRIREIESDEWLPAHPFLVRGLLHTIIMLRDSDCCESMRRRSATVYGLIAYAIRRQISH